MSFLASLILAGCGTAASANAQPTLPFVLVTVAPNASPTPTPFQPLPSTLTGSPLPTDDTLQSTPPADSATQTATPPASTQTEAPTIDPNMLINTVAPLAT
ncbi:MAG: hypothetical protein ABIU06_13185, partial [Anaerolineales bacterium]